MKKFTYILAWAVCLFSGLAILSILAEGGEILTLLYSGSVVYWCIRIILDYKARSKVE